MGCKIAQCFAQLRNSAAGEIADFRPRFLAIGNESDGDGHALRRALMEEAASAERLIVGVWSDDEQRRGGGWGPSRDGIERMAPERFVSTADSSVEISRR